MRTSLPLGVAAILIAALSAAAPAMAMGQEPPDRSRVELAIGENVRITTRDGRTQTGRLVIASPAQLTLVDGSRQRQIPWADIRQIDRRSRGAVRKSTLIGLGVGLGVGMVALGTGGCTEDAGTFAFECVSLFAATGAGVGALTGVLINALRQPRIVYRGEQQGELTLAPVVSPNRAGVFGRIRW